MCPRVGLIVNLIGFLMIAYEWHRTFRYTEDIRQRQLEDAYERNVAREEGREPEFKMSIEEETMAKVFSKLRHEEAKRRALLFYGGVILVVLGTIMQMAG